MRLLSVILATLCVAGCSETGLRIEINADVGLEQSLQKLVVTVVAIQNNLEDVPDGGLSDTGPSADAGPDSEMYDAGTDADAGGDSELRLAYTCRQQAREFTGRSLSFPLSINVRPGREFLWRCVAVRVQGYSLNEGELQQSIRTESLFCEDFYNDISRGDIYLFSRCTYECASDQVCEESLGGSACVPPHLDWIFDVTPAIDRSCEASND